MNKLKEINGRYYQECEVVMLATEKATWPNCIWLGRISNQLRLDTSYNHKPKSISPIDNSMLPQHLYFLSNEEIKEGDWCYHPEISQEYSIVTKEGIKTGLHPAQGVFRWKSTTNPWYKKAKKIIATTDTSLKISRENSHLNSIWKLDGALLPQPSKEFIQAYIKAYNEGKPITKVLVEYKKCYNQPIDENYEKFGDLWVSVELKVNSSNEITIKKIKEFYTQEEVDALLDRNTCQITAQILEKFKEYKSREEIIEKLNTAFTGIGSKNNCIGAIMSTNGILTIYNLNKWIEENL